MIQVEYTDEEPDEQVFDINKMLGDGGADGAFISVSRLRAGKTPEKCIDRMTPDDFLESGVEYIRANFGAGDYKATAFSPNPRNSGRLSPRGSARFSIAAPLQQANTSQNVTGIESIAIILQQQQQQTAAILQALSGGGGGEERVLGMLTALKGVITPPPPPPPPPPPKTLMEQIMEARLYMQFTQELEAMGNDGKSKMWATAAQMLPAFAPAIMAKMQQPQQQQQQQQPQQPNEVMPSDMYISGGEGENVSNETIETKEGEEMGKLVTNRFEAANKIVQFLTADEKPNFDGAIEYMNGCSDEIVKFCASDDAVSTIIGFRPDLMIYREVLNEFRSKVLKEFFEQDEKGVMQ